MVTAHLTAEAIHAPDAQLLAIHQLDRPAAQRIDVSSTAFEPGEPIPIVHSEFGRRQSPDLTIVNVPVDAQSLVLLVEDPDAPNPKPFIHWAVYNLPAATTMIRANQPDAEQLASLGGAVQVKNSAGTVGYFGMKPPASHGAHHYHFQVFALDRLLQFAAGEVADRALILAKMKGHVLAAGVLIGTFKAP